MAWARLGYTSRQRGDTVGVGIGTVKFTLGLGEFNGDIIKGVV